MRGSGTAPPQHPPRQRPSRRAAPVRVAPGPPRDGAAAPAPSRPLAPPPPARPTLCPDPPREQAWGGGAMYQRILFGMDSQGHAGQALPVVTTLARTSGAEVVVLHVRDASLELVAPAIAEGHVEDAVRRLAGGGVSARGKLVTTYDTEPAARIAAMAGEIGADLVALGSHGRTHIG